MGSPESAADAGPVAEKIDIPRPLVDASGLPAHAVEGETPVKVAIRNLNFFYGKHQALFDNTIDIPSNRVTAM